MVKDTSKMSYNEALVRGLIGIRQNEVYNAFLKYGDSTDLEIAAMLEEDANYVKECIVNEYLNEMNGVVA